jgi:hypothetical protein
MTRVAARFHPLDAVPRPVEPPPPRRRLWLLVAMLFAGIALAVGLLSGRRDAPDARSVRIDVDGDGSAATIDGPFRSLPAALEERLTALGFVVPKPGTEAALTLTLGVSLSEAEPLLGGRLHERRAEVSITVRDAEARRSTEGPTVDAAAADKTRAGVEHRLALALVDPVFEAALPALLEHPAVRPLLERAAGDDAHAHANADALRPAAAWLRGDHGRAGGRPKPIDGRDRRGARTLPGATWFRVMVRRTPGSPSSAQDRPARWWSGR